MYKRTQEIPGYSIEYLSNEDLPHPSKWEASEYDWMRALFKQRQDEFFEHVQKNRSKFPQFRILGES